MDNLLYYLFVIFYFIVKHIPKFLKKSILNFFSWMLWNLDFFRKKIVLKNLEIAFPDKSKEERVKIAKEFYKKFVFYMASIIDNIDVTIEELKKIEVIGEENLIKAKNLNKPIVFMTAHFGNWEVVPKIIGGVYKIPMVVLMREFDNPKIGEFFKKSRNSFNISTLNKKSSARDIIKAFKEDKALGVLIDQHSTNKTAVDVEFFGKTVKFNRAISTLAKKFGVVVVPMFSYSEKEKYYLEFLEPKEFDKNDTIEEFTQWQAKIIEDMIKAHPSEYYWFHKRFKNIKNIY